MTTQLSVYNEALRFLGERRLASLSEDREPRYLLDGVWDDNAVDYCLEQGLWNFATRTIEITYDPDVTPAFGYTYAFNKPSDFIRTAMVCCDENFTVPLLNHSDERDFWFSDLDTLYIKYISNDSEYGGDLSIWPQTFVKFFAAWMGLEIAPTLKKDDKVEALEAKMLRRLTDARSKDAMTSPTKFPATGSWVSSRFGHSRGDRGVRSRLIG